MTFRIKPIAPVILFMAAASAQAAPTVSVSTFATGGAVSATQPDSITDGAGSVWVEYGNGADSTGLSGHSTIVRYSTSGAVEHVYTIAGLVDGLKFNPATGMVWALQNNDGNAKLSLINPATSTVSSALMYQSPPYVYGPTSARGYDDVAFLNGKVYLSYTNPVNPTDPVLQSLNNGNSPTGTLGTTTILTAQQGGLTTPRTNEPDIDSLKSTPNGKLVLTTEGDGPGCCDPVGEFTLISNPGMTGQTVTNVHVTSAGNNVQGMDDVIFPGAKSGWLYVAETDTNKVDKIWLSGLDPNTPIVAIGGLHEVALVNPTTGALGSALLSGLSSPHGMDFVAATSAPEPSTWPMLLLGLGGVAMTAAGRRRSRAESQLATAN